MQVMQIILPDFVNTDIQEIRFMLAAKMYEQGKLSIGQSADLSGLSKRTFMELLGNYGVSVFNYPAEEIERDFETA